MVRRRRSSGFTLIELLIAMGLSTIGLLGLLALQSIAIRGNMMSRNFSEAIGIAQQRLETTERTPYTSLSTVAEGPSSCLTTFGGTPGVSPTADTSSLQAIYTRCTNVTSNADNTTDIKVRVWWRDERNNAHSVELDSKRSP